MVSVKEGIVWVRFGRFINEVGRKGFYTRIIDLCVISACKIKEENFINKCRFSFFYITENCWKKTKNTLGGNGNS